MAMRTNLRAAQALQVLSWPSMLPRWGAVAGLADWGPPPRIERPAGGL